MRHYFAEGRVSFPLPNLSETQLQSYQRFLERGVQEVLEEINPIEDYTGRGWRLSFSDPRFDSPNRTVEEAVGSGLVHDSPWYLKATLAKGGSQKKRTQEIYMGDIPQMTDWGTFIINGVERVVVNQLIRAAGVFFVGDTDSATRRVLAGAKILPKHGVWLEIETSKSGVISVKIDRHRRLPITTLLRIFGLVNNSQIEAAFTSVDTGSEVRYIEATLARDSITSYDEAILEIYRHLRPGEPAILENAKTLVEDTFFSHRRYSLGEVGRFKLNQKLGLSFPNDREHHRLFLEDLIAIVQRIIQINNGLEKLDDIDHLGNRRVRSVGELLQAQMRIGFLQMERNIKERMSLQPRGELCDPRVLISPRPVAARVHAFFASSQLSQYQDQCNPLAGLNHLRRLSVMGPGGLTKRRASFSVRDAHYTHYGKICPVQTPEGPNIGLITYLALYSRVNEYGFLEAPYRKVTTDRQGRVKVTGKIVYLAAYDEEDVYITDASVQVDKNGYILDKQVPLRHRGEFFLGDVTQAQYIDVVPQQAVGLAAALIPFLANDDVNRALVGVQQASQAVPLIRPEAPVVGTGMEADAAENAGTVIRAEGDGVVTFADASVVDIQPNGKGSKEKAYHPKKFVQSNMDTCYNQRVLVETGQKVKKGQLIVEGPSCEDGELALGANLKVAYMTWEGFGYEDSIVLSERLVREDILSSIHITDHSVQVLETKLGPEEVTCDIPNVSEGALRNLDESGVVTVGAKVKAGDILVGKIAPKGEQELSAEERLLRAIFGEKARDIRDNSLVLPHGEHGTVIGVRVLTKENNDELPTGVLSEIKVLVAQVRKIVVGDKLAGRHGNKGVVSIIVSQEDMPHLPDGTPIDIILSPASVVARMNLGQILEAQLGGAAEALGVKYALPSFERVSDENLEAELKKTGRPGSGKVKLIDGRTGEFFDQEILVGGAYIQKLYHLAEDKMHARSTGPYSLITQQPLGGKAQFGGQRFGEMEVWALEAYAASHTLREMLTTKSDDVVGRTQAYRAILQGEPIPLPDVPESFKLLVRELNGLGLKVEALDKKEALKYEKAGGSAQSAKGKV
ncbi:DNA-directed RNA polymerase subunit beta [Candidatus Parcubacteria bacterium]|nr:DNA-directed RNA polymerase subunit beta [Candidatus Parcubacteria bacterium]